MTVGLRHITYILCTSQGLLDLQAQLPLPASPLRLTCNIHTQAHIPEVQTSANFPKW